MSRLLCAGLWARPGLWSGAGLAQGFRGLPVCQVHLVKPSFRSPGAWSSFQGWRSLSVHRERSFSASHSLGHALHNNQFQNLQGVNILSSLMVPKIPLMGGKAFYSTTATRHLKCKCTFDGNPWNSRNHKSKCL